jgi:hypothetical protein
MTQKAEAIKVTVDKQDCIKLTFVQSYTCELYI